jgi:hypothetical protein
MKETDQEAIKRVLRDDGDPCEWCKSMIFDLKTMADMCCKKGCKKYSKFEFCTDYDFEVS